MNRNIIRFSLLLFDFAIELLISAKIFRGYCCVNFMIQNSDRAKCPMLTQGGNVFYSVEESKCTLKKK